MPSKHEILKGIVNEVFDVDVMHKCRKRDIVDARMVYSKILKDDGYSLSDIGRALDRHHTTIIAYIREGEYAIPNIRKLQERYYMCKEIYDGKTSPFRESMSYPKLVDTISIMEKQLYELKEYKVWYEQKYGIN